MVSSLEQKLEALRARTGSLPRPSVVCLEWLEPVFAMSNWGPELIELAGGTPLLGTLGAHSTTTDWAAVREANPEVLVVTACGFSLERTLAEMHVLERNPGWSQLRAVQGGRVFVADGNLYFNRSGPTLFDTPRLLAEILHPEALDAMYGGHFWRRFER